MEGSENSTEASLRQPPSKSVPSSPEFVSPVLNEPSFDALKIVSDFRRGRDETRGATLPKTYKVYLDPEIG